MLLIPWGALAAPDIDDSAAAAQRRRIAEMLRRGEEVRVNANGTLHEPGAAAPAASDATAPEAAGTGASAADDDLPEAEVELVIPTGKLA